MKGLDFLRQYLWVVLCFGTTCALLECFVFGNASVDDEICGSTAELTFGGSVILISCVLASSVNTIAIIHARSSSATVLKMFQRRALVFLLSFLITWAPIIVYWFLRRNGSHISRLLRLFLGAPELLNGFSNVLVYTQFASARQFSSRQSNTNPRTAEFPVMILTHAEVIEVSCDAGTPRHENAEDENEVAAQNTGKQESQKGRVARRARREELLRDHAFDCAADQLGMTFLIA